MIKKKIPFVKQVFIKSLSTMDEELLDNIVKFPTVASSIKIFNKSDQTIQVLLMSKNYKKELVPAEETFGLDGGEVFPMSNGEIHLDAVSFSSTPNPDGTLEAHDELEVLIIAGLMGSENLDG